MIGRTFLGKTLFRVRDLLGSKHPDYLGEEPTMYGMDVVLTGHELQARPIGEDSLYKEGAYEGKSLNKPRGASERPGDAPSPDQLVQEGELFAKEFQDVVLLRKVHRAIKAGDARLKGMTKEEQEVYLEESREFQEVLRHMADLSWSRGEHAWLSKRNKSALMRTEEGRRLLKSFRHAPLLMDTKKGSQAGEDGADKMNMWELNRCAKERGVPILAVNAKHDKPETAVDLKCELMDAEEFKGLDACLHLCVGARVLLTQNLWVEAGLMNGALGWVRGFQFPAGYDPRSRDGEKRVPVCVVVEFDNVQLSYDVVVDESGRASQVPRTFYPDLDLGVDEDGRPRARKCVPIYWQEMLSATEEGVCRKQFPLTLAWALTHWKAQGMTLDKVRVALGARVAQSLGVGYVCSTRV